MIKVKWFTKSAEEKPQVSIKVEGTLEIKDPDLADFESYKRKVRKEQLLKEVDKMVESILPDVEKVYGCYTHFEFRNGYFSARTLLKEKIMEQIEIE